MRNRYRLQAGVLLLLYLIYSGLPVAARAYEPLAVSLPGAVKMALEHSPGIQLAEERVSSATDRWLESRAAILAPKVSVETLPATGQTANVKGELQPVTTSLKLSISIKTPVAVSGDARLELEQIDLVHIMSEYDLAKAQLDAVFNATSKFYETLKAEQLKAVSEEGVRRSEEQLRMISAKVANGTASPLDQTRSEIQLANARQALLKAGHVLTKAYLDLKQALGLPLEQSVKVISGEADVHFAVSLEDALAQAYKNRPEVLAAEAALEKSKTAWEQEKRSTRPTVSLTGRYNWNQTDVSLSLDDQLRMGSTVSYTTSLFDESPAATASDPTWNVGIKFDWTVFDGGVARDKIDQAARAVRQQELALEQVLQGIELEIRGLFMNILETREKLKTMAQNVELAEESLRIANLRYESGVAASSEVLDAEVALLQAQTDQIETQYDLLTLQAKLERAMGVAVQGGESE